MLKRIKRFLHGRNIRKIWSFLQNSDILAVTFFSEKPGFSAEKLGFSPVFLRKTGFI